MTWLKRLFCLHLSWAKCGYRPQIPHQNENWYVCKECGNERNFGFEVIGPFAFAKLPINFDGTYETYWSKP